MKRSGTQLSTSSTRTQAATKAKQTKRLRFNVPRLVRQPRTGFPKQLHMKHSYVEGISISGTSGSIGKHFYRCNGMFDPNMTGAGHQPMYFDQVGAIYDHFTVLRSKLTAQFALGAGSTATVCVAGMYIDDDTTSTPATYQGCCEQNSSVYSEITLAPETPIRMTKSWDAKQAFGGDVMDNDNLQGTSAADPTEQQLWVLFGQDLNVAANFTLYVLVTIEYDVIWDELKNIDSS